jgi:hypothetical protein
MIANPHAWSPHRGRHADCWSGPEEDPTPRWRQNKALVMIIECLESRILFTSVASSSNLVPWAATAPAATTIVPQVAAQASVQLRFGSTAAGVEVLTVNGGGVVRQTYAYPPGLTSARARSRALALLLAAAEKLGAPHRANAPRINGDVLALRLRTASAGCSLWLTGSSAQSVMLMPETPYPQSTTIRTLRARAFAEYRNVVAVLLGTAGQRH